MTVPIPEERTHRLISEAAEWRLLSALLSRPTDSGKQEVKALAAEVRTPALTDAAVEFCRANEGFYLSVLGPSGPVSPREVTYRGSHDPGLVLSDLQAFYEAFSYRPRREDPPDHVGVESGFVGFLLLKVLYAELSGRAQDLETTRQAVLSFTSSHLSGFSERFAERLSSVGVEGHLTSAAEYLTTKVKTLTVPAVRIDTA